MSNARKLLDQILRGNADANVPFSGLVQLLKRLGFQERIKGSHHVFTRDGVMEILNLQPRVISASHIKSNRSAML